jgi:hypothetical protein
MDYAKLFEIAEQARRRDRLVPDDLAFIRETAPAALADFPRVTPPKSVRHPGGFAISGAPVGTFLRSALLLAGQKALGRRYGSHAFYEHVEDDLAMRIMRSYFNGGAPKGAFCCKQCTLAILPVLDAGAIRWFDGQSLAKEVRRLINAREWRFASPPNGVMLKWALAGRD